MKRILVAVDLSDVSNLVVARAVEVARTMNAKLKLLRAVPLPPVPPPGAFVPPQIEAIRSAAERSLDEVLALVPAELRDGDGVEICFGDAAVAICDTARTWDADLVVVGAHRYGVFARALGTTAARIVNRLDRPVLVVRPVHRADGTTEESGERLRAGEVLRREHARLETIYTRLLDAYRRGDWDEVRSEWDVFEPALVAHLELEETRIFPLLERVDAAEAATLKAEHDELRKMLGALGVRIDLHAVPAADAEELIRRLRAHGKREGELHTWLDSEPAGPKRERVSPAA